MLLRGFLFILYHILRLVVKVYQRLFYPFTVVTNRTGLQFKGPGIIVGNHPNTMTDPLHVVSRTNRQAFFLANASMFKHPVANFLLNYLYCIPVSRPNKDKNGPKISLTESFARSFDHLAKGNVLFIAPEGGSEMDRRLRPLKTGTARIALGTEAQNNFNLGIKIYPAGLTYGDPKNCGSSLVMNIGQPILAKDWQAAYQKDPKEAVASLTDAIAEEMRSLIIDTVDEEQDQLLRRLERIQANDKPLSTLQHYERSQQLLSQLKSLRFQNINSYNTLVEKATAYSTALRQSQQTDRGLSKRTSWLLTLISLLGLPIWLYGRINNTLGYDIPRWLERKMALDKGYTATVKILTGAILIPLFYTLQYQLVKWLTNPAIAKWYLLSLPISAILAWLYARYVVPRLEGYRWRRWAKTQPTAAQELLAQRRQLQEIIASLPADDITHSAKE